MQANGFRFLKVIMFPIIAHNKRNDRWGDGKMGKFILNKKKYIIHIGGYLTIEIYTKYNKNSGYFLSFSARF